MPLIWFRNDLRIDDNPALTAAINHANAQQLPCHALFISTPQQWQQHHMAAIKIDFIQRHVNQLAQQLAQMGIKLQHIQVSDFAAQQQALIHYCQQHQIQTVYANSEVELNEARRDQQLITQGLKLQLSEADCIIAKGSLTNSQGEMYKVFTPFKKVWLQRLQQSPLKLDSPAPLANISTLEAPAIIQFDGPIICSDKWPLANVVTQQVLPRFLQHKHANYHHDRDYPANKGTSGLSPYLAIGAISAKRVVSELLHHYPALLHEGDQTQLSWLNELAWHDFYRHLVHHFPQLCKGNNFNHKYDALPWPNRMDYFTAWCQGKTGYPIVDAAMRQLVTTGWMHNRLRMIVASFLTKHLLVDWRLGERFFIQHLIDGDLCANNGGWQWSAGTGCDAQPYFRIFNPITQSEKYDPNGHFIRNYLPELENVPLKHLHFPHAYLANQAHHDYWPPLVEHKTARQ